MYYCNYCGIHCPRRHHRQGQGDREKGGGRKDKRGGRNEKEGGRKEKEGGRKEINGEIEGNKTRFFFTK